MSQFDLLNIEHVKGLKANLRGTFENEPGKETMKFLEELCGWFDFKESDPNQILINTGKRQVLATIKTFLACSPEEIVATVLQKENE